MRTEGRRDRRWPGRRGLPARLRTNQDRAVRECLRVRCRRHHHRAEP